VRIEFTTVVNSILSQILTLPIIGNVPRRDTVGIIHHG
jgi:hypothetical protein